MGRQTASLLLVLVIASITSNAPVFGQCTTKHSIDADSEHQNLMTTMSRLQDTVKQQHHVLITLITKIENTLAKHDQDLQELKKLCESATPCLLTTPSPFTSPSPVSSPNPSSTTPGQPALNCADLMKKGHSASGVYTVHLSPGLKPTEVYCDMTTDGGGWLVIQRRIDGSVNFYRDWNSYKAGFGDISGEFWLGNDHIHALTAHTKYTLRIDMEDFEGVSKYAVYSIFTVASESNKYKLSAGGYSGTAGDSLAYHDGQWFSAKDRDNDSYGLHCAQACKGSWWYKGCYHANLNALYLHGAFTSFYDGIAWGAWHGTKYSLKTVIMKLRPS